MKDQESLSLSEQVGETTATAEDRLEAAVVPALESAFNAISAMVTSVMERLGQFRRRA